MNSSLLELSQELIDQVVDFLDEGSLVHSALVHPVFVYRSQLRLFSMIYIASDRVQWGYTHISHRCNRLNAFREILQVSPHIARYVRGLSLQISSSDNSWIAEEPTFLAIMDTIKQMGSCIETLHLIGMLFPEKLSDARLFEQNFMKPFISSSLRTLVISGILDVPISLIANSPCLRNLKTFRSSLESFGDNLDLSLLRCSPNIQDLQYLPPDGTIESVLVHNTLCSQRTKQSRISDVGPTITRLQVHSTVFMQSMTGDLLNLPPIVGLAKLRSITTVTEDLQVLQGLIEVAKHSLQELNLFESFLYLDDIMKYDYYELPPRQFFFLPDYINLSETSRLRALSVDVLFPLTTRRSLEDICKVLKTIPDQNCLEEITLNFYIGFESSTDIQSAINVDWKSVDSEMVRIACNMPLHLSFKMTYQMQDSDSKYSQSDDEYDAVEYGETEKACKDILRSLLKENFPEINAAPSISLDYSYDVVAY